MPDAFLIDGIRTAIGSFGGGLSAVRSDDMAAHVIRELLARHANLDAALIDDVIMGCANQAGEDNRNVARMALLLAGVPASVPGETINRLCASGMCAVINASRAIRSGEGDLFVAGGVESMTRAPYVVSKSAAPFGRDAQMFDTSIGWRFVNKALDKQYGTDGMGNTAENVAEKFSISREDQDAFALRSQQKAAAAQSAGRFEREITPLGIPQRKGDPVVFKADEFIRANSSIEGLAKLKPAFRFDGKGSVTAGNSSGINDGAAALLVASGAMCERLGVQPKLRLVASAAVGVEPRIMGMGPVEATRKALQRAGLTLDQMDVIELNEAFAAQSLGCLRELGLTDDDARVNPNGGAIALGHPLGMSGARLAITAMHELEAKQGRYALCTMCVGVGQGVAAIFERVGAA